MGWIYDARKDRWIFAPTYPNDIQYDFSVHPNFTGIKTTNNRYYNPENIYYINQKLKDIPILQRAIILANIIEESGGDPLSVDKSGIYRGLLQWDSSRYIPKSKDSQIELDNQIQYILDTYQNTTDRKSWNKNGDAYESAQDAFEHFNGTKINYTQPIQYSAFRAFTRGYVRPSGKDFSVENRYKVFQQLYDKMQ